MNRVTNTTNHTRTDRVIPVFFAVDDHYAPFLAVAIRSLIYNASPDYEYHIYVLIKQLASEHQKHLLNMTRNNVKIELVDVSERLTLFHEALHVRDYYTCATYYRFFIPDLFPQYDRAIYLDSDIVVKGDISKLYRTPLNGHMLGAVADDMVNDFDVFGDYVEAVVQVARSEYFNAGILLMDLDKMRRVGLYDSFISLLTQKTFRVAQDQDYLNVLCQGKIELLDDCWNKNARPDASEPHDLHIIHFKINWKPWHYKGVRFEEHFWKYADMTPYKEWLVNLRDHYKKEDKERDEAQYQALLALALSETKKARGSLLIAQ